MKDGISTGQLLVFARRADEYFDRGRLENWLRDGLIDAEGRTEGGKRLYSVVDLAAVRFAMAVVPIVGTVTTKALIETLRGDKRMPGNVCLLMVRGRGTGIFWFSKDDAKGINKEIAQHTALGACVAIVPVWQYFQEAATFAEEKER